MTSEIALCNEFLEKSPIPNYLVNSQTEGKSKTFPKLCAAYSLGIRLCPSHAWISFANRRARVATLLALPIQ